MKRESFVLPTGHKIQVDIPQEHESKLVELALRTIIGTLVGIASEGDRKRRRNFLIKYIGALINISEMTLKRMVVAKDLEPSSMSHIVDEFLKSLTKGGDTTK